MLPVFGWRSGEVALLVATGAGKAKAQHLAVDLRRHHSLPADGAVPHAVLVEDLGEALQRLNQQCQPQNPEKFFVSGTPFRQATAAGR